jgi:hypothetical protein
MRKQTLNFGYIRRRDIRDNEMLVRGQAKLAFMYLGNLSQSTLEFTARFILYATVFDKASEMVVAILAGLPAKVVDVTVERILSGRLELDTRQFLDLCFEGIKAHAIDRILQAAILPAARNCWWYAEQK